MKKIKATSTPDERPARSVESESSVGYCRPPKDKQFKPGRSGNPYGRPRGSRNSATLVQEHLETIVTVRENGRVRKMTKLQVGLTKMANRFAEKGELKVFKDLMKLLDRPEAQTVEVRRPVEIDQLSADQLEHVFEEQMARQVSRLISPGAWVPKTSPGEPAWYEPPQSE